MIVVMLRESFELPCYNVGSCYVKVLLHSLPFKLELYELVKRSRVIQTLLEEETIDEPSLPELVRRDLRKIGPKVP